MKRKVLAILATVVMLVSTTVTAFADTETGLIGQYNFDGDLKNEVTGEEAVITGNTIIVSPTGNEEIAYVDGVTGKAVLLDGADSAYGIEIVDGVPDTNTFTFSYDIFYTMYSIHTPALFLAKSWDAASAAWVSFGVGWQTSLSYASGIWVNDVANKNPALWVDGWKTGGVPSLVDESGNWQVWTNITYVVDKGAVKVYVDGDYIGPLATGFAEDASVITVVDETSRLFIGVNAWDTPLSGAMDNLYIFDRALTEEDIDELLNSREYDIAKPLEVKGGNSGTNTETPTEEVTNRDDYMSDAGDATENDGGSSIGIIIAVVAVIVVAAVVVIVVLNSKNKGKKEKEEEEEFFI